MIHNLLVLDLKLWDIENVICHPRMILYDVLKFSKYRLDMLWSEASLYIWIINPEPILSFDVALILTQGIRRDTLPGAT